MAMIRAMTTIETLVSEQLWQAIQPLLPAPAPRCGGRPRVDDRAALAGIVYQLRTGVPWRLLPARQLGCGSPVTCWRRLRLATRRRLAAPAPGAVGPARPRWPARLVARQPGLGERARQAGGELTGPNPTDRGKPGSKYHLLVDRGGIPLAVGLSAANTHDSMLLEAMVDTIAPVKRPADALADPASARPSCTATRGMTTRAAGGRCAGGGSARGSLGVASSRASGWAATAMWSSGHWRGWWATGGCRSATSGAPRSCSASCTWPAR
jgi:transposase